MKTRTLLSKSYLLLIVIVMIMISCSQGPSDPPPGNNAGGETLKEINDVCYITYKNGRIANFQKRELSYSTDTCFVYYDNQGKVNKIVRQEGVSYYSYYYTLAFYYYNNSKVSQITMPGRFTSTKINPDTLSVNAYGMDTTSFCTERYYFDYDPQGRLWHMKFRRTPASCSASFTYDDTLKYADNTTKNISKVIRKRNTGTIDSVSFTQYETAANPVNKYVPELFYLQIPGGSRYNNICQPYQFSGEDMTTYLALSPNFIKKLRFWYSFVYSSCYCEYTPSNHFDSKGNVKSSGGYLDLIGYAIGYTYSYD